MGLFAALMTYLLAAALLVGGALTGLSVLLTPSETNGTAKASPPLVRAATRKAGESQKTAVAPQAAAPASGSVVTPKPANPSHQVIRPKQQAGSQPVQKKKIATPAISVPPASSAPSAPETATQAYGPEPRKFIFPFDPGW